MKKALSNLIGMLGILLLLLFGGKVAKRAFDRDLDPTPLFDNGDCIKLAYRDHGDHGMVDSVQNGMYSIKFFKEVPSWDQDEDGMRFYDPYYKVVDTKEYNIREGNQFFEMVNCPSSVVEEEDAE